MCLIFAKLIRLIIQRHLSYFNEETQTIFECMILEEMWPDNAKKVYIKMLLNRDQASCWEIAKHLQKGTDGNKKNSKQISNKLDPLSAQILRKSPKSQRFWVGQSGCKMFRFCIFCRKKWILSRRKWHALRSEPTLHFILL